MFFPSWYPFPPYLFLVIFEDLSQILDLSKACHKVFSCPIICSNIEHFTHQATAHVSLIDWLQKFIELDSWVMLSGIYHPHVKKLLFLHQRKLLLGDTPLYLMYGLIPYFIYSIIIYHSYFFLFMFPLLIDFKNS